MNQQVDLMKRSVPASRSKFICLCFLKNHHFYYKIFALKIFNTLIISKYILPPGILLFSASERIRKSYQKYNDKDY